MCSMFGNKFACQVKFKSDFGCILNVASHGVDLFISLLGKGVLSSQLRELMGRVPAGKNYSTSLVSPVTLSSDN